MKQIVLILIFLGLVLLSECQVIRIGRCPNAAVIQEFEPARYLGKWYEDERFYFLAENGLKCVSANYSMNTDGSIKVLNSGINKMTGRKSDAVGRATLGKDQKAKLSVKFSRWQPAGNYWVLDTDYDTYTLVWSCSDFFIVHTEIAWILTRDRAGVDETTKNRLKDILSSYNVNVGEFMKTDQTGC